MIGIFLAGEGRNELGSWSGDEGYQSDAEPGVVKALLEKIRGDGWQIVGAIQWKNIHKLRSGFHGKAEERNVLGAVLKAQEKGAHVAAFVRDRDGYEQRQRDIDAGILGAQSILPHVIGGMAVEKLESWIVAILGGSASETMRRPEDYLAERGIGEKNTAGMVSAVASADMGRIPEDAASLRLWLLRARETCDAVSSGASSS